MSAKLSPDCTYKSGDETCFRADCPMVCMRNYRDQAGSDMPLISQARRPEPKPQSWWQTHLGRSNGRTHQ